MPAGKPVGKEAAALRGDSAGKRATKAVKRACKPTPDDSMSLMVDEESNLFITLGTDRMCLNADQVARLTSFAARVMGAPA